MAITLDPVLLEVLACPAEHHAPLSLGAPGDPEAAALTCTDGAAAAGPENVTAVPGASCRAAVSNVIGSAPGKSSGWSVGSAMQVASRVPTCAFWPSFEKGAETIGCEKPLSPIAATS